MEDCIFCKIARKEIGDLVFEDDLVAAFRDINPQAPVHILIIPKEHIEDANGLAQHPETAQRLFTAAVEIADKEGVKEEGYRLVLNCGAKAGQSVWHVHLHLLGGRPMRWPPG